MKKLNNKNSLKKKTAPEKNTSVDMSMYNLFRSTGMMLMGTWEEARRNRATLGMSFRAVPVFVLDTAISSKAFVGKKRLQACYKLNIHCKSG